MGYIQLWNMIYSLMYKQGINIHFDYKRKIMVTIHIKDDFIKLGQALKLAGLVDSGVDAKFVIQDGLVKVNGAVEVQRGKKLVSGDVVSYNGKEFTIG